MKRLIGLGTAVVAFALSALTSWAQQTVDLKMLESAKVTLERALEIAGRHGKPVSAKFEIENGKLQLSVYTVKAGKFSEVLINHQTGKVAKVEPITEGDDLKAAQEQSAAIRQAKLSLAAATKKALKENAGSRAISVVPSIETGHGVAAVTLASGQGSKTVSESLQ
jgi:uncharacterized membrane protein YkoI